MAHDINIKGITNCTEIIYTKEEEEEKEKNDASVQAVHKIHTHHRRSFKKLHTQDYIKLHKEKTTSRF